MNNQHFTQLYESDAHAWFLETAKAVKEGRFEVLDIDNLVEELESMGKKEKRILERYLSLLFLHLLKWQYQPERRCASWEKSIKIHRKHAKIQIAQKPSLRGHMGSILEEAYDLALLDAYKETNLDIFPDTMPFTLEEALQEDWLP